MHSVFDECVAWIERYPFLRGILAEAFPSQDGIAFEDHVEIEKVGPDEVMYPRTLIWRPGDDALSPFERPDEQRRVIVCLSDATRVVRTLCLQECDDVVPWEALVSEMQIGRSKITRNLRLPADVFVKSGYDPRPEPEKVLWHDGLSLAVVTVWVRPVGEFAFVRSAAIQFATHPEHGFQFHQRA